MEAVRCEAITPAPIPFPLKAALPGIAAAFIALVFVFSAFVHFVHIAGRAGHSATLPVSVQAALLAAIHLGLGWVALSLLLSLIAMAGSMRLAGSRI